MRRAIGLGALLWMLWAVGAPAPAGAHALLAGADPSDGANLSASPGAVTLTFTEQPDPALSSVDVIDAAGTSFVSGVAVPAGDPLRLRAALIDLADGVYTVSWRVFSKVDGHLTAGAFAFGVNADPDDIAAAELPPERTPSTSPLEVAGRFGFYVGLAALIGTGWVAVFAFPAPVAGHRRLAAAGAAAATIGWLAIAQVQREASGAGLSSFLSSGVGRAVMWRGLALAVCAAALLLAFARGVRWVFAVAVVAALVAVRVHVSAGHAAAGTLPFVWVSLQSAHFGAAAVWIGGLSALLVGVRGVAGEVKARAVRRFSTVAAVTIGLVAFTGTARAVQEVGRFGALFSTSYGRVVVAKVAGLLVLGALGAVNRYRSVPDAERTLRPLQRIGRIELVVAALVLSLAGLLATLVPSRSVVATAPDAVAVEGTDLARTVEVRLEVSPGLPGANEFTVTLTPPQADRVALRLEPDDAHVEGSTLELDRESDGVWSGRGANISVAGLWRVVVLVGRGARSVEVPLMFATRCRSDAIRSPGAPTLHDVGLGGGRKTQGYADPGSSGFNEIHFTFFDAQGRELPISGEVEMSALKVGSGQPVPLDVRRFGPGHFIGGGELEPGPYRFDVRADDGGRLTACFEEEIG